MYIVLEGIVWTGKSTQAKKIADYLGEKHPDKEILLTREPWGTEIAEHIRTLVQATAFEENMAPVTEAYLYAAARAQLITQKIKPVLDKDGIVICDRNVISSMVIQGITKWLWMETVLSINMVALQNCMPDLLLFFDLPLDIALSRTFDDEGDKHEREWREFYEKQFDGYHKLGKHPLFSTIWKTIDAKGSIDDVWEKVEEILTEAI